MRLWILSMCIFSSLFLIAQTDAAYDWVMAPDLKYATYEENPNKSSGDKMINLWFSDANGTWFYPAIDEKPIHYDYVTSPYSRFLLDKKMILIESPKGLIFANREGKKLRATSYLTLQPLGEGGIYRGKTKEEEFEEVYDFEKDKVLFRVPAGNLIERVGGYFKVSGYENPTQIFDPKGKLLLEREGISLTILETDELRILAIDYARNTHVIMDASGATIAELPRNVFDAKGDGGRIMVRLGAFKKYWIDLQGDKLTSPFSTSLIDGEIDVMYNCGATYKVGAYFHDSGITLPCEYDFVAKTLGDSTVIRAKKGNLTYYLDREGKPLYDANPFTITRYLGGDYFVGARNRKCEIVHRDGRTIIPTDIYPIDPTRVANVGYLPDSEGGKLMVADKLMRNLAIYDTSGAIIYQRTSTDYSLNWGLKDDYIYITEGNKTGLIDLNGEEVLPIKYRHLEIFEVGGEIKYLKTSQIYADRIDPAKGGIGLLDGVATHLVDAKTNEVIISGNTGLRWINEDHLMVYFGTTYGVARLK